MLLRGTVILMAVSLSVASEATAQDTVGEDKISTERGRSVKSIELSREHVAAVNRRRRVVVNFDVIHGDPSFTERPIGELIKHRFTLVDDPTIRIDSILREPRNGEQAWKTWEIEAKDTDDTELFWIATEVQRRCDGVVGTNSMIHDYYRELQRFAD